MGSKTSLRLPIIDFSTPMLKQGTPEWESVKSQVQKALEEYGCFQALFAKVPLDLRKSIIGDLEELFDLPLQTKLRNISSKPYLGYVGQSPLVPLYESLGIEDAPVPEKAKDFTDLLWPQGNDKFCKTIQSYSSQLSELDQIIRRMVVESYGLETYLDDHMESTKYILRVMKYKEPQTTDPKVGLSPHTDKNMVTILYQNQVDGFEVQTKDGGWINVKPSPDSFTVMIGDSFHAWTNGRLHCPSHCVMMRGDKPRYSVGLFSIPKTGYIIKVPEELVDEEHPLLFKPFDYDEFIKFFYTEGSGKDQPVLKTFCGI